MNRSGSTATKTWPASIERSHVLNSEPTSRPTPAPARTPLRISTINPRPNPLGPAAGRRQPPAAASGSSVGFPAESSADPAGNRPRAPWMVRTSEPASVLVARSTRSVAPDGVGHPNASGLVPRTARVPPNGATLGKALLQVKPTQPASAARAQ